MRLRLEHDRSARGGRRAGDPLARPHPRPAAQLVDRRPVRRAQDELVGPLVVEVDEARVRLERVGTLSATSDEDLLEVERRVDGLDRLRQETQMPFARFHPPASVRSPS